VKEALAACRNLVPPPPPEAKAPPPEAPPVPLADQIARAQAGIGGENSAEQLWRQQFSASLPERVRSALSDDEMAKCIDMVRSGDANGAIGTAYQLAATKAAKTEADEPKKAEKDK
jgi:hypothetical protein